MNWLEFKKISEREFKYIELEGGLFGYQMQPGTKWNKGLSDDQIRKLEEKFGFKLSNDYRDFIKVMNGIDTDLISIDPFELEDDSYSQLYYEYPKDCERISELLEEIDKFKKCIDEVLTDAGFSVSDIEGYVPTYAHRSLVVFKDKSLSPVISVWGSDVVVLAENLEEYWIKELGLEYCF